METPKPVIRSNLYSVPVKRYCQILDLRDSPELIAEYRKDIVKRRHGLKSLQVSGK